MGDKLQGQGGLVKQGSHSVCIGLVLWRRKFVNASWPGFCCLSVHRAHLPEQKLQRPFRWACSAAKQDGPQCPTLRIALALGKGSVSGLLGFEVSAKTSRLQQSRITASMQGFCHGAQITAKEPPDGFFPCLASSFAASACHPTCPANMRISLPRNTGC